MPRWIHTFPIFSLHLLQEEWPLLAFLVEYEFSNMVGPWALNGGNRELDSVQCVVSFGRVEIWNVDIYFSRMTQTFDPHMISILE